ncbi:D-alanyl-D-alanine carboxypeptidase/D-alanyl-D-alanine-endopeptidase [Corynebacterium spheniscorum]|nr:D-alanyl-D-alanine carboxypeptidase/D-alanyl-D-alanine-endopeptidase [Corynebacterium spheniscorum]
MTSAVVVTVAVTGVAGVGITAQKNYADVVHKAPWELSASTDAELIPARGQAEVDLGSLRSTLKELSANPALGSFGVQILDSSTGEEVYSYDAQIPLRPASATKILTSAAAIKALGPDDRIRTDIVRGPMEGSVVIRAAGDVWLDRADLMRAAEAIQVSGMKVTQVLIDTSVWTGPDFLTGWDESDIDAGFVAPMQPAMIHGGRLGEVESGDVPRSHTPAFTVAQALGEELGVSTIGVTELTEQPVETLYTIESPRLSERLRAMMQHSDNVMAEAIGREVAIKRGKGSDAQAATEAVLEVLNELGIDTSTTKLEDTCGLSIHNRIPAEVLAEIMDTAAQTQVLRPLLDVLPVAGGSGTLASRFIGTPGRGVVRAKTGTLTGTSALTGVVTGQSGHVYSFGMISNDTDVLGQRQALDRIASALSEDAAANSGVQAAKANADAQPTISESKHNPSTSDR